MRIASLRLEEGVAGPRAIADIVWEGRRRDVFTLWYETDAAFAEDFEAAPEAFALAAMPFAAGLEEPRLQVEGALDARLAEGLGQAMRLLATWYPWCREVPVEVTGGLTSRPPRSPPRAGGFVSGGIDSLSMLRANREAFPLDDPASIRDAIFHFGWSAHDFVGDDVDPERLRVHQEQRVRLERLGQEVGFTVLPLRTNARLLHPRHAFLRDAAWGAGMVSGAHLWRRRLSRVTLASSGVVPGSPPHGSHPQLDPLFGSGVLEVCVGEPTATRTEKVRRVADWAPGLAALQVCVMHDLLPPGQANCGRCEKCLRTMLALEAMGRLGHATAFPRTTLTPKDVAPLRVAGWYQVAFALETVASLEAAGRGDLAAVVRAKRRAALRRERRRRWRKQAKRLWARWWGRPSSPTPLV